MALFGTLRAKRRDEAELGKGIWRRTHDRYVRGLDRYHQVLEMTEGELYEELVVVANALASGLPRVRALCTAAQRRFPSEGLDVPGGGATAVHRRLSRAGNALATTAEAAAMSCLDYDRWGIASANVENVRRRAEAVLAEIAAAEESADFS